MKFEIDVKKLKENYPQDWIEELYKDYQEAIKDIPGIAYWKSPSKWVRNKMDGAEKRNYTYFKKFDGYFKEMLYPCNTCILDYIIKNKKHFKNYKFLDYGGGMGILSIFLKKIGIECYNYDNFNQLDNKILNSPFFKKYNISPPTSDILIFNSCNILTNSGIPVYYNEGKKGLIFNMDTAKVQYYTQGNKTGSSFPKSVSNHKFDYLFLDGHYLSKCKLEIGEYNLIDEYSNIIKIYKK